MKYSGEIKSQINGHWQVGDWCVCEYKIQMVKEVALDGRVISISDGHFSHGGSDLRDRMFPLTLFTKNMSEEINDRYDKLYQTTKNASLNWPDIYRKFVDFHVDGCHKALFYEEQYEHARGKKREEIDKAFKDFYESIDKFSQPIIDLVNNLKDTEIDGLKIFRK
jgi:hypothetical protein